MGIINFRKSLYWRLSLSFLLVLLLLAISYIVIVTYATDKYYNETTQRLNAEVADYLVKESPPFKNGEVDKESLGVIMHSMMAVNPGIEVYLVSPDGEILSFVVLDKKVKLSRVNTAPIKSFIGSKGQQYVLGDDPRNPGEETIFSATEVHQDGLFLGYVYIVLASEKYETTHALVSNSYWIKLGVNSFLLTLIAAFTIGLILIWVLTRNLRVIIQTVKQFADGDLHARIPVSNKQNELSVLSTNFNDMADTILKNIDELKQVDSLRRELIANVSHDLRNPLAIIQGYIETLLMKSDSLSKEDTIKYMKVIHKSSEKLTRLVADLFELSKLEARQVQLQKEPFFVQELISDACLKSKLLTDNKNISVESVISEGIPMAYGDLAMMDRVIQNLLDNAIKYTPADGHIKLLVDKVDGGINVSVQNTGEGISEKDLPNIFNRYYKVDKEKEGIEGTGLGLAIVKNILEVHQSQIKVESTVNEITNFHFTLPAYSA
ncbi:sensor histidine kinase [Saccharicrinis aurantiacus]|uniref:sensor histidine kinase n=1 Tax=Saccharicrinis aurantiacus TaxID=1849719 RepID=UPI00094F6CD9|nr:HAMP domain-containing sensor histidine kinase [Saccharicrinis aurantiacus]